MLVVGVHSNEMIKLHIYIFFLQTLPMETIFEIVTFLGFVTLAAILSVWPHSPENIRFLIITYRLKTKTYRKVPKDICKPLVNYQDLKRI